MYSHANLDFESCIAVLLIDGQVLGANEGDWL